MIRGHGKVIDGEKNLIHSKHNFTAVLGVSDTIVINTEDVTLVVNKDKVENIKDLVKLLNDNNMGHLT